MTQPAIALEGVSIVLLGSFNPQIFQPAWFAAEELVRKEEADAAEVDIIHREIVSFSTSWMQLQVKLDRFMVSTADSAFYEPLRDLVLGTFQLLRHTPIQKMGLNRNLHFRVASEDAWHAIGHRLAPKEPWTKVLDKPGMLRLEIQGARPDDASGYMRVRVEPSRQIMPGVFVNVNDHYELPDTEATQGCDKMMDILNRVWKVSVERSTKMAQALLESA